jgi:hypothetical protein
MVVIMDMSSGERLEEFGPYEDEVLCANWLPLPQLGLQQQELRRERPAISLPPPEDIDAFLRRMYLSQE